MGYERSRTMCRGQMMYSPYFPHKLGQVLLDGEKQVAVVAIGGGSALLSNGSAVMCRTLDDFPPVEPTLILTEEQIDFEELCIERAKEVFGDPDNVPEGTGRNEVFPKLLELARAK